MAAHHAPHLVHLGRLQAVEGGQRPDQLGGLGQAERSDGPESQVRLAGAGEREAVAAGEQQPADRGVGRPCGQQLAQRLVGHRPRSGPGQVVLEVVQHDEDRNGPQHVLAQQGEAVLPAQVLAPGHLGGLERRGGRAPAHDEVLAHHAGHRGQDLVDRHLAGHLGHQGSGLAGLGEGHQLGGQGCLADAADAVQYQPGPVGVDQLGRPRPLLVAASHEVAYVPPRNEPDPGRRRPLVERGQLRASHNAGTTSGRAASARRP